MSQIAAERRAPRKWLVLIAMCLGLSMLMLDTFMVTVALPTITRDFDASLAKAEWLVSAYVFVMAVLPLAMGRAGDIFGRRRMFYWGLALFVGASGACGVAPSIEALILARVVQGAGAAIMQPGTLSLITQAFPATQRGLAIGIWSGVSGLGLIAGPLLGGLLVQGTGDWRWIFLVNLPVGLACVVMTARFVPESRDDTAGRSIDWLGVASISAGLLLLMLALNRGNAAGWTSALVLGSASLGVVALIAFVVIERRVPRPLVDLTLFRKPTLVAACLAAFLFNATVFGVQPFISLFMQNYWGFTPIQGGLAFLPATALVATLMPFSGFMGQRLGNRLRLMMIVASLAVLTSALVVARIDLESTYSDSLLPGFLIRGLGIGLFMPMSTFAVISAVPLAKSGLASGTLTMFRNLGTSFGVALLGAVYVRDISGRTLDAEAVEQVEHFVAGGEGVARQASEAAIVGGFASIAEATVVLAVLVGLAAFFIRRVVPVTRAREIGSDGGKREADAAGG
jgi:EmrB/QacA subfamily drug resistance transporter